jgi:hypothetical protein
MNAVDSSARAIRVGPEPWRETADANLTGVLHPARASPPGMIEHPGEAGLPRPALPDRSGPPKDAGGPGPNAARRAPESDTDGLSGRAALNGGLSGWTG